MWSVLTAELYNSVILPVAKWKIKEAIYIASQSKVEYKTTYTKATSKVNIRID